MHAEVKRCVESNDMKGLKYIFVDCFVVDPTFEKYREDYEYCRQIPGIFETYRELTPIRSNENLWNEEYWEKLKLDLMKNFSIKRFEHMIEVAQIIYADKISRLLQERKTAELKMCESSEEKPADAGQNFRQKTEQSAPETVQQWNLDQSMGDARRAAAYEEEKLDKRKRELEIENQRVEEEQRRQREHIVARKAELASQNTALKERELKKAMGIGLAAAAVVIIIILIQIF